MGWFRISGGFGSRSAKNDPSTDAIVAPIRKIISDDAAPPQVNGQPSANPSESGAPGAGGADVLLSTDLIEDPKPDQAAKGTPSTPPRLNLVRAADTPQPPPETIEDLIREMLRPMLKEWLDRNLPSMVERYVEREIAQLSRR
jgi:cell pole-organizing protein PopZ